MNSNGLFMLAHMCTCILLLIIGLNETHKKHTAVYVPPPQLSKSIRAQTQSLKGKTQEAGWCIWVSLLCIKQNIYEHLNTPFPRENTLPFLLKSAGLSSGLGTWQNSSLSFITFKYKKKSQLKVPQVKTSVGRISHVLHFDPTYQVKGQLGVNTFSQLMVTSGAWGDGVPHSSCWWIYCCCLFLLKVWFQMFLLCRPQCASVGGGLSIKTSCSVSCPS